MRLLQLLKPLLTEYRWYRKKIGGTWYLVKDPKETDEWGEPEPFWTQVVPEGFEVVRVEVLDRPR
jgi:hypothetical protein